MNDYVQQFKTEVDATVPASVEWGTAVGASFFALLFAVLIIGALIRKYTSD